MNAGEIALQFKHQSGKSIGIKAVVKEVVSVRPKHLAEIHQFCLSLKDIGIIRQLGVLQLLLIVFVAYLADNLFENILKGYDTACAAVFIHHYGDVYLVSLKLL